MLAPPHSLHHPGWQTSTAGRPTQVCLPTTPPTSRWRRLPVPDSRCGSRHPGPCSPVQGSSSGTCLPPETARAGTPRMSLAPQWRCNHPGICRPSTSRMVHIRRPGCPRTWQRCWPHSPGRRLRPGQRSPPCACRGGTCTPRTCLRGGLRILASHIGTHVSCCGPDAWCSRVT